jgi:hypothetical protein
MYCFLSRDCSCYIQFKLAIQQQQTADSVRLPLCCTLEVSMHATGHLYTGFLGFETVLKIPRCHFMLLVQPSPADWNLPEINNLLWGEITLPNYITKLHYQITLPNYVTKLHYQITLPNYVTKLRYQITWPNYITKLRYQITLPNYVTKIHYQITLPNYITKLHSKSRTLALMRSQNSAVLSSIPYCHRSVFLPKFSTLYFPYQKDERAKPGNVLTKWCHLPPPPNIKVPLVLLYSSLCSVLFTYHHCLRTVLVFVTVACLGYVSVLRRWFSQLSSAGCQTDLHGITRDAHNRSRSFIVL